jgi:hypothetical protein
VRPTFKLVSGYNLIVPISHSCESPHIDGVGLPKKHGRGVGEIELNNTIEATSRNSWWLNCTFYPVDQVGTQLLEAKSFITIAGVE